ncbi:CMRF35-like molecule 1 [Cheilinus undulatus]|uniref:CMRF35-like molecule 1 n=1 Tax=Cheilinus undulatus TaxID=241271 RepID=UPI001BD58419|nr:CMRF35-like molecule 1 [Cheilinus undulatus]
MLTVKPGKRSESERITLEDSGDGAFTVTFRQLQLSDSGRYWCAVERTGFDTFIAVHLTVKKAVVTETTTVTHVPSSTWTYQDISESTQQTSGITTGCPTNISTASNCTNGGKQTSSTGTVLYVTIGGGMALAIVVLATWFRRSRKRSNPQSHVHSNSTGLVSADKREQVTCKHPEAGEKKQSMKKSSKSRSSPHTAKQNPPKAASTETACSDPSPVYENICCSSSAADYRYTDKPDVSSGVYINPLPLKVSESMSDGSSGRYTTSNTAARNVRNKPSQCAAPVCESSDSRPKSLWFGLDLSGTV